MREQVPEPQLAPQLDRKIRTVSPLREFFVKNVLPRLTAEREIAANVDLAVMQLREEAF